MLRSAMMGITTLMLLLWLGLAPAGPALAQAEEAAEPDGPATTEGAGVVQELDFAAGTLVIDGMRYQVAVDVKVEINGSYGAFTMLEEEMRVYFEYRYESPTERIVTLIRELPADVVLEQS